MKNDKNVSTNRQKDYDIKRIDASGVHSAVQKSKTLYRQTIQRPVNRNATLLRKSGRNMDIAKSKSIARFSQQPATISPVKKAPVPLSIEPKQSRHPLAARVDNLRKAAKTSIQAPVNKTAAMIKKEAITKAFDKIKDNEQKKGITKKLKIRSTNIFIIAIILIFLSIIGFFVYINIPTMSVRVASAQAGIKASFPEYHPDGYSLSGPVSYSDGEVTITFQSNTNSSKYIINQSRSSWDSSAVKNKVSKDSNGEFVTTTEHGLTIYTYAGNASWVNGGILYTITGDATLSGDQIRRIATSL
jgi:flagellar basal body-associated protein FliL